MSGNKQKRHERLREILIERKRKLWNELREELFGTLGKEYNTQFDRPLDVCDHSIADLIEDTGLKVADIRREELTHMEVAERRLAEGTYGICEDCGVQIPEARLEVLPFALRCVACQDKLESPVRPTSGVTL